MVYYQNHLNPGSGGQGSTSNAGCGGGGAHYGKRGEIQSLELHQ